MSIPKSKKVVVGKIYAEWCGHCITLKPEWDAMKIDLKSYPDIELVEIEEKEKDKLDEFKKKYPNVEISGYPTILKVSGETIEYYNGERTKDKIKDWILLSTDKTKGVGVFSRNKGKKTKQKKTKRQMNRFKKTKKHRGLYK